MKLAIFDLDNTLISGDSDYLWGEFLCEHDYIDVENHRQDHQRYYDDYKAGKLDIIEFLEFQLKPLAENDLETLCKWRNNYLEEKIKPVILDKAISLIDDHRQQGHELLIITATNRFLTEPIVSLFGIDELIASEAEMVDGGYTGKPIGVPSYAVGKVVRLNEWLHKQNKTLDESWFYSDSHNDIPLLKYVDHPITVDPDEILKEEAEKEGWSIISLR
jgi:HAD superfamily hydrolase (TIGR01490 family)